MLHGQLVPSCSLAAQLPPSIQSLGAAVISTFLSAGTVSEQTVLKELIATAFPSRDPRDVVCELQGVPDWQILFFLNLDPSSC